MKKVLIVGAKGMLGQELVRVFSADKNYQVFGWDKLLMSDINSIDITDEAQAVGKVGALAPAIIINAAAYNAVDKAEEPAEFELAKKLNGLAPGYLAKAAKEIHNPPTPKAELSSGLCVRGAGEGSSLRKGSEFTSPYPSPSQGEGEIPPNPPFTKWGKGAIFVHYSSDYVFDGEKKEGYLENDEPSPISNYGRTKLMGEQEVAKIGGKYYIIRLQKLFGQSAQNTSAKKSFFETMLFLAQTKKELEVVDEELANFTFAPDLAEYTKFLVDSNFFNPPCATPKASAVAEAMADASARRATPSPRLRESEAGLCVRGAGKGIISARGEEKSSLTLLLQRRETYPFGIYHITNEGNPVTWFGAAKVLFEINKDCYSRENRNPGPGSRVKPGMTNYDNIKLIPVPSSKFSRPAKRPKYSILLNTKLPPLRPWPEALKEFLVDNDCNAL